MKVYEVAHRTNATGKAYVLAWSTSEGRKTQAFADPAAALEEGRLKAGQIAAGRIEAADMSRSDRDELQAARDAAGGVPLLTIVQEWQKARALAGGDILPACEAWAQRHGNTQKKKTTVAEAISQFLKAKRADGVNTKAGLERTLPGFEKALGNQLIASVTPAQISEYLQQFTNKGSRNSHRKRVVALFRWCRKQALLPLDVLTAAERTDAARGHRTTIGLVSAEQLRQAFAIIAEKAPHYVPALAVAAFCGLRRSEVHGQLWQDIDLPRGLLRVSAAKPNTPARRLVPIPPAAVEWLNPYQSKEGPICANLAIDRIRDICRTAGLNLADNGFRHSWISARVTITGNIPETSIEAGNTPQVLNQHYRELLRKDEAEEWFAVCPQPA